MLSVIIPVYNSEKYLEECLNSICSQTYKDLEIICVNDGSTDNSLQILKDFENKDKRIKVIDQANKGVSETRNVGLCNATGEYVTFVDSDDILVEDAYELALKYINEVDVVCFGIKVFGENSITTKSADDEYYRIKFTGKNLLTEDILLKTDVSCCNKIFKMDIIKKYNIHFPTNLHYEDANLYWKYMIFSKKAYFIDKYLYNYRRRENSIMANTFSGCSFILDHLHILEDLHLFFAKNNILNKYKKIFCKIFKTYTLFVYYTIAEKEKINALKLAQKYAQEFFPNENPTIFIKHLKKGKFSNLLEKDLNLLQKIFSIKTTPNLFTQEKYQKIVILGMSFIHKDKYAILQNLIQKQNEEIIQTNKKLEQKNKEILDLYNELLHLNEISLKKYEKNLTKIENILIDMYLDKIIQKREQNIFNLSDYTKNITFQPEYLCVDSSHNFLNILINQEKFKYKENNFNPDKTIISWETARWDENRRTILYAITQNKDILFIGDSFLRSIDTFANKNAKEKFKKGLSFCIDDLGYYYDATRPTRMEVILNDKNLIITDEQKQRARKCIDKIIKTHLTKYNHQPIFEPKIGREGVKKVLVVDQSYGDMSITKGLADENTFKEMLECAIKENPNADIIVKTHPDTMAGAGGYYTGLKEHGNIYTQTEPINPISLIKYVDKVYVCTTQFGFEALMCNKEVHVFGMPFYAGWGLTHDRQKCERRTNTRSLEEVFYIAYILYSYYVNPEKECHCEIEEAMDYLLKLRDEYFRNKTE